MKLLDFCSHHGNFGIFQGCVSSVPKNPFDYVPIQIVCHKSILRGEKEYEVVEAFKCLWKNAKCVVESSKDCPPSMTKYQQNFCLLIHEVLRSNPHLFTDDEKNFMGIKSNSLCLCFLFPFEFFFFPDRLTFLYMLYVCRIIYFTLKW